jgi:hypothetical protein
VLDIWLIFLSRFWTPLQSVTLTERLYPKLWHVSPCNQDFILAASSFKELKCLGVRLSTRGGMVIFGRASLTIRSSVSRYCGRINGCQLSLYSRYLYPHILSGYFAEISTRTFRMRLCYGDSCRIRTSSHFTEYTSMKWGETGLA